jgi:protein-S-isoprenylcysteine O-methyltransferase Ste14
LGNACHGADVIIAQTMGALWGLVGSTSIATLLKGLDMSPAFVIPADRQHVVCHTLLLLWMWVGRSSPIARWQGKQEIILFLGALLCHTLLLLWMWVGRSSPFAGWQGKQEIISFSGASPLVAGPSASGVTG